MVARPGFEKGLPGVEVRWNRMGGRFAIPVTKINLKKLRENTDQVRLSTWPTRKSPAVKRPAGNNASVMTDPSIWPKSDRDFVAMVLLVAHLPFPYHALINDVCNKIWMRTRS